MLDDAVVFNADRSAGPRQAVLFPTELTPDRIENSFASPDTLSGEAYSNGTPDIGVGSSTATPTAGAGTLAYLWSRIDGGADAWTISNPSSASTAFAASNVSPGEFRSATFSCTVTGPGGVTATTNAVNATAFNHGGSGGFIP